MRLAWTDLGSAESGAIVELHGFPLAANAARRAGTFLLLPEPRCCTGHAPADPAGAVEVFAPHPIALAGGAMRLTGTWRVATDAGGWRYQLHDARPMVPPGWGSVTRRAAMMAGPLMCLAAPGQAAGPDAARAVLAAAPAVDMHSHAGHIASLKRITSGGVFSAIAKPMREGRMAAICLATVSDSPTHHVVGGRIRPFRDPGVGELYNYGTLCFQRVHDLVKREGLRVIARGADFTAEPGVVIAAEGADFLEGKIERLDEAYHRWTLRHLQLTHYRVNELGDIQTEPPVHGGLTPFGAEVIRRCNRLGIVVDVAHGTLDLVRKAAAVSSKPLILSHTSLTNHPLPYTRQITAEHAKAIAATGGAIGVWPVIDFFGSMTAMAVGIARLADVVGVDHVGLGTDLRGLVGGSAIGDYDEMPAFAEALLAAGFSPADAAKVLGGNYRRVFAASI